MPLLAIERLSRRFGGVVALEGVSLTLTAGEIAGLIGPNGAGKTTLFNLVTAVAKPDGGRIVLNGKDLVGLAPHRVARLGVARTFQAVEPFRTMTVFENVLVPLRSSRREARERVREVLEYLDLASFRDERADRLPFGTLKRIGLARALVTRPRLLLLDEPAGGLEREEVARLALLLERIRRELETTVLLVEHHMGLVMEACERVHVLNFGRLIASGAPAQIARHPAVVEAYLGAADAAA